MPKFSEAYASIEITLPSYSDSKVQIRTNVSVEDTVEYEKGSTEIEKTILLAQRMIVSWNFTDEKGNTVGITAENIKQLPANDLQFLFETIMPYIQKKALSAKIK